jgi:hypothetical protein
MNNATGELGVTYFEARSFRCIECPSMGSFLALVGGVIGGILAIALALYLLVEYPPKHLAQLSHVLYGLLMKMFHLHRVPLLKVTFVFFQCVAALPRTFNLHMPPLYFRWSASLEALEFDWTYLMLPGSCMAGGARARLLLRALCPLALLAVVLLITFLIGMGRRSYKAHEHSVASRRFSMAVASLLDGLPVVLLICYCLVLPASSSIFATWSCVEYGDDATTDPPTYQSFLRSDPLFKCADVQGSTETSTREYEELKAISWWFVFVWPIAMPLLFAALLMPCYEAIRAGRVTQLVHATSFLHADYKPQFSWWEFVFLSQRLILVGFVQARKCRKLK